MTANMIIGVVNLFCVGILAGEEFIIRYGVRAPIASLDEKPHIQVRQALIRTLRILVPAIFALTLTSGIGLTIANGFDHMFGIRLAGVLALLTFIGITLGGTVPLNKAVLTWEPAAPPSNWQTVVNKWERLDTVRCWAAIAAFVLFLSAMAL
jgi:uncharacterized membrane protein